MTAPTVSVFVQIYRTAPWLRRCLDSVLALRGPYEMEILAIDDASPDESGAIAASYRDSRLRVVRHSANAGANRTANEGYAWARGKYVARIDSDDAYRPDFLTTLVPMLEENPRVGLAYGDVAVVDEAGTVSRAEGNVSRHGRPPVGDEFIPLCETNFVPAPATLVRREALASLLPIPAEYSFLDWYVSTGIAECWSTAYADRVVAEYRLHGSNQHRRMVLDGSGERITVSVLNRLWSNGRRRPEKVRSRGRVFGANYRLLGDKYFGYGRIRDARRCYARAVRERPALLASPGLMRRWTATFLGLGAYGGMKRLGRALTRRGRGVGSATP